MSLVRDNMKTIIFSADINTINELKNKEVLKNSLICSDEKELFKLLSDDEASIIISDYDSIATELNNIISSGYTLKNLVVLEKHPEIATGKSLIYKGAKAYGNSRMLSHHLKQMLDTVTRGDIWSYPELTASLIDKKNNLSIESLQMIKNRLSHKEQEVIYLVLSGLTNDAIASKLTITQRTVKAHISSIFSKLHVNDRLSLVLLLKS